MKGVAQTLYREPVVFLGAIQGGLTALAAAGEIAAWIPLFSLAVVTPLQRHYVKPRRKS